MYPRCPCRLEGEGLRDGIVSVDGFLSVVPAEQADTVTVPQVYGREERYR